MTRDVARWQRLAHGLHRRGVPLAPRLITLALRLVFGCYLPHTCSVGAGTRFGYGGLGTVVHGRAVIAANAVVTRDVASETLVGGVPATLVRSDIDIGRYLALARPGEPAR